MSIGPALLPPAPLPTFDAIPIGRRSRPRALGAVLTEAQMDGVATFELAGGTAVVFTTVAPYKESPNEDVAALIPTGPTSGVLMVADGVGGHAGGERASRLATEAIQRTLHETVTANGDGNPADDSLRGAILNGIEAANRTVRELGSGSATTLALVEIQDGIVRPYHVGDSVILLMGQRGKLKLQTIAHSPIGYAVEAGLLAEEEAIHHEQRHVISNVIGSEQMRIEIGPAVEMARRDTLLVASDGLLDNLLPADIVEFVRAGALEEAVTAMVVEALRRMTGSEQDPMPSKPDDLTVIAYRRN